MPDTMIMTVRGPIEPVEIETMLPHEHVVHTFGDPATTSPAYDFDHVMKIALPGPPVP